MSSSTSNQASDDAARRERELLARLKNVLRDKKLVVVVGAGVTLSATADVEGRPLPRLSWTGLIRNGLDYLVTEGYVEASNRRTKRAYDALEDANTDGLLDAANTMAVQLSQNGQLSTWLESVFGNLYAEVRHPATLEVLKALHQKGATLLTTNYDDILEKFCSLRRIGRSHPDDVQKFKRGDVDGVFHIHGSYHDPHEVVLDATDYSRVTHSDEVHTILKNCLEFRTILFVGCGSGLEDPNFDALLKWVCKQHKNLSNRHCLLVRDGDSLTYGPLVRVKYGADYHNLAAYLRKLLDDRFQLEELPSYPAREAGLVKNLERTKKLEILGWISKMPYTQHHETVRKGRLENSGLWLFDQLDYVKWRKSRSSSLLWLHGIPGSGKSKLVSLVVDTLKENAQAEPLAYVYCTQSTTEPQRADPDHILRSILRQLSCAKPSMPIREPVVKKYQELQEDGFDPRELTLAAARTLILELLASNVTTIIIDALDECNPKRRFELLSSIEQFLQPANCVVKILISSRDPRISSRLDKPSNFSINAGLNSRDIERFVELEVARSIQEERLLDGKVSSHLRDKIITTLKGGAQGMFLWVSLQIQNFCDPERFKLEEDVLEELGRLPRELADIYSQIYNKISGDRAGQHARKIAETALQWLLCAQKSLSTADFITAVYFSVTGGGAQMSSSAFLDICGNLLIVDKELDVFRFFHLSVREFLQARPDFAPSLTHATAAEICINTLLTREWLSSEITWQKASLYQYVTLYWASHIENCSKDGLTGKIGNGLAQLSTADGRVPPWFAKWLLQVDSASQTLGWDDPLKDKIEHTLSDVPATSFFTGCVFGLTDTVETLTKINADVIRRANAKGATGLHLASQYGHIDIVELLVDQGAEINRKDGDGETPLVRASSAGHDQTVKLLLSKGADAKIQGQKYGTALQAASLRGQENVVQLLLKDADLESEGGQFGTALQAASLRGHSQVVRILLDKGAEVNALGGQYITTPQITPDRVTSSGISRVFKFLLGKQHLSSLAVVRSTQSRYETIVQLLLDRRLDFNVEAAGFGTALQAASRGGHEDVVKILLDRGADVNVEGGAYGTALQAAAVYGNGAAIKLLLDKGADVNAQKGVYNTALQAASRRNYVEIVETLLDRGADVNAQGGVYGTALQAAVRSQSLGLVQILLDKGADVDAWGGQYGTALQAASIDGPEEIVQVLLDYEANLDIEGGKFGTALQAASGTGNAKVVRLLVDKGAKFGRALQIASIGGHEDVVSLLLDEGADPNAQQGSFGTALQMATAGAREEIVQLLIDRKADANGEGGHFGTALQVAAAAGNQRLVRLLLGKGADPGMTGGDYGTKAAQLLHEEGTETSDKKQHISALESASAAGHEEIVQMLLDEFSKRTNIRKGYRVERILYDALREASENGHLPVVRLLLDNGVGVNSDNEYDHSPLELASQNGHEDIVRILLEKDAEINTKRYPPLPSATKNNHESIVRLLVQRGADVNKHSDYGTALHIAAHRGYQSLVRLFLDKGADSRTQEGAKCSAILLASFAGHDEIVNMLIQKNADVNAKQADYSSAYCEIASLGTALQAAAFKGHENIVRMLIENDAAINECEGVYKTALLAASFKGHENIVHMLIASGADVDIIQKGRHGFGTALQAAAYGGFESIVQLLLDSYADVNAEGGRYGTAIQAAASRGHESTVRLLIQYGADLRSQGGEPEKADAASMKLAKPSGSRRQNGMFGTALQAAAASGNVEIVRLLLENGADIGDKDKHGQTPLHRAAYHGHEAVVALLLEHGTNINIKDGLGRTALRWAATYGYGQLFGFLSRNGASIDERDARGQSALHRAAFNGQLHIMQTLLEKGANVECIDRRGRTALFSAAENGQVSAIRFLLGKGARIDHRDSSGSTVLHEAAHCGRHTLLRPLLDGGADVEARNVEKKTPLHVAAEHDRYEFPYLLLINGASIEARDSTKSTPLHVAASKGNCIVVTLLLDKKANIRAQDSRGTNSTKVCRALSQRLCRGNAFT